MDVRIDLYADALAGQYVAEVQAAPPGVAFPRDLPGRSADVVLDGAPPKPGARSLLFTAAVASPLGLGVLDRPGCILTAYLYHPRDDAALLAFDARVTDDYSAFYATRGVYYTGTYRVVGPDGPCIAEIFVYDTADREEAERMGNENLPEHIAALEQERQQLQNASRRRYLLWLGPRQGGG